MTTLLYDNLEETLRILPFPIPDLITLKYFYRHLIMKEIKDIVI